MSAFTNGMNAVTKRLEQTSIQPISVPTECTEDGEVEEKMGALIFLKKNIRALKGQKEGWGGFVNKSKKL